MGGSKFGITNMRIVVTGNGEITQGKAECNLPFSLHYECICPKFHSYPCYHKLIPYTQLQVATDFSILSVLYMLLLFIRLGAWNFNKL